MTSDAPTTPKVLSVDEMKERWNDWSNAWDQQYEHLTITVSHTLLAFLQLSSASSILEIACGAGGGARLCNMLKPKSAKLTCIDLAEGMVAKATAKVNDPSVTIQLGNALSLSFGNDSFDRIYSAYCLHLVPDPDVMLREVHRVLKPGGIAAFSVWGRKENADSLIYVNTIAAEMGISLTPPGPPVRTPFHLGQDSEALRTRALNAGFSKCIAFYQSHPTPLLDPSKITTAMLLPPPTAKAFSLLPMEKQTQLRERLDAYAKNLLDSGKPIPMEALIIVATK